MKWQARTAKKEYPVVALFTRAWIEIHKKMRERKLLRVALFTRAWIEIVYKADPSNDHPVALFTRAWIEIIALAIIIVLLPSRPLHEGVD